MPLWKRALLALVIVFIIYAVLNDPTGSASVTGNAWDQVKDGFSAVGIFFDTLIGG